jgi:ABC-type transporter Mla maintaining outer membrane lipid asymmetry ATPase subunit MlaF
MRANGTGRPYVILGASGSGKSSLMKAGVLPRLRRERGWIVLRAFRPGADPLSNFAASIAQTMADYGQTQGGVKFATNFAKRGGR